MLSQEQVRTRYVTRESLVPVIEPTLPTWDEGTSLAYLVARMQTHYAALISVFSHIKKRIPSFQPTHMVDVGSGPGTAIW